MFALTLAVIDLLHIIFCFNATSPPGQGGSGLPSACHFTVMHGHELHHLLQPCVSHPSTSLGGFPRLLTFPIKHVAGLHQPLQPCVSSSALHMHDANRLASST